MSQRVKKYKRGDLVPDNAVWLESESDMIDGNYVDHDIFIVPAKKDSLPKKLKPIVIKEEEADLL